MFYLELRFFFWNKGFIGLYWTLSIIQEIFIKQMTRNNKSDVSKWIFVSPQLKPINSDALGMKSRNLQFLQILYDPSNAKHFEGSCILGNITHFQLTNFIWGANKLQLHPQGLPYPTMVYYTHSNLPDPNLDHRFQKPSTVVLPMPHLRMSEPSHRVKWIHIGPATFMPVITPLLALKMPSGEPPLGNWEKMTKQKAWLDPLHSTDFWQALSGIQTKAGLGNRVHSKGALAFGGELWSWGSATTHQPAFQDPSILLGVPGILKTVPKWLISGLICDVTQCQDLAPAAERSQAHQLQSSV